MTFHEVFIVFFAGFFAGLVLSWVGVLVAHQAAEYQARNFIEQQKETAKSSCHQMDGEIETLERWYEL